ncbi:hypothetical protein E2605_08245 [Dysgonomonas capnocytophagoides]|uniref:Uncharacterized protein n=1 Tax=Dysgonomonas capnocytophagoides TaxID=45254 RepID=A0A4Y8L2C1_9BACT|nr:hypothetical protein [Dysgonomonas capnocytophagoides]TFD96799.1 hypothetical protein E2605_08245 [Dysgonomonas capnocytophagoides]
MAKYTEKLGKQIAEAIEQDEYTLGEICSIHNISRKTFYQWMIKYPDFEEMVENARLERDERLAQKARQILRQRVEQGHTVTRTRYKYAVDEYGELYLAGKTVTVKEYAPDEKTLKMAISKESDISNKEKKNLAELKEKERILQEELEYQLWKEEEEREYQESLQKSAAEYQSYANNV